jgi:hypothetical protein
MANGPERMSAGPPGVTLSVANDGRLEAIGSGHGQTIMVRGVPLTSMLYVDAGCGCVFAASLFVRGDHVVAALKEPFVVAGEMRRPAPGSVSTLRTGMYRWPARAGGYRIEAVGVRTQSSNDRLTPSVCLRGSINLWDDGRQRHYELCAAPHTDTPVRDSTPASVTQPSRKPGPPGAFADVCRSPQRSRWRPRGQSSPFRARRFRPVPVCSRPSAPRLPELR